MGANEGLWWGGGGQGALDGELREAEGRGRSPVGAGDDQHLQDWRRSLH